MKLSVSQYDIMKEYLSEFITVSSYKTIANEMRQLMPIMEDPYDFILDGEVAGKYWPLRPVIQDTVIDILEKYHGDNPERVESELFIRGGFGGDGFSGCTDRVGRDVDLNTSSRYVLGMKIARILGKRNFDESFPRAKEYFVETSQPFVTVKPILIGHFKETTENLHEIWSWTEKQWETVKTFTIQFHSREIKVHFENPKLIGDGKCFLQLLGLPCAYCYLCYTSCEEAQCTDDFKIKRSIEEMRRELEKLEENWRNSDTNKKFTDYYPAKERDFMVDYPAFKDGGFSVHNIPTMHFKIHIFDMIKKIAYQMNSRRHTESGKSVLEIQNLRGGKDKMTKYKVSKQKCRNPHCRQICKGFVALKSHVIKKSQRCLYFYTQANILEELEINAKAELKFRKKILNQSLLQSHLDTAKNDFKKMIRYQLGIKINQIKLAGHGASVENGPTTMKFLHPDNREKVLDLFYCVNDVERNNLDTLLDQASVIIGVTNRIGQVKVQEFQQYVKNAHNHWRNNFKKFVHIKNSIHWTMAHVSELITGNEGYTLAEVSENSFENWIKAYR